MFKTSKVALKNQAILGDVKTKKKMPMGFKIVDNRVWQNNIDSVSSCRTHQTLQCVKSEPISRVAKDKTEISITTQNLKFDPPGSMPGSSQIVGKKMKAHLSPKDPLKGSGPGDSNMELYTELNKKYNYNPTFIKGHLLNDNLGGPGLVENLYPITKSANGAHSGSVEEPVKANFLALEEYLKSSNFIPTGIMGSIYSFFTGMGIPSGATHLYYEVEAKHDNEGSDFLKDPKSTFICNAFFSNGKKMLGAPLIKNEKITSDPFNKTPNSKNDRLGKLGWGSYKSGARKQGSEEQIKYKNNGKIIAGPQWDPKTGKIKQGSIVHIKLN